jgi:hypothetical protein
MSHASDCNVEKEGRPDAAPKRTGGGPDYLEVASIRPVDSHQTCLRPLGLCELGGACDTCWYRPDHPRFED